ncbi:hypothetical protein FACS189481_4260 [Clostridia bacterium]|nr:hypothetical protein FACS189481_4260 [Clostridia bacterium]
MVDPEGASEEATLLNLLNDRSMLAELKSENNIKRGDPYEIRVLEATSNDNLLPRKFLVWLVRPNDPQQQTKEAYGNSVGYSKCDIVSERTMPVQSTGNPEGAPIAKVIKVVFKNDPIVVDASHQVENGLLGMMRDIILRLVRLLGRERARALFGMMWQIFVWKGSGAAKHALIARDLRMRPYDEACVCQQAGAFFYSLAPAERQALSKDDPRLKNLQDALCSLLSSTIAEPHYHPGRSLEQLTSELEKGRTEARYEHTTSPFAGLLAAARVCLGSVYGPCPPISPLGASEKTTSRTIIGLVAFSPRCVDSALRLLRTNVIASWRQHLEASVCTAVRYPAVALTNDAKPFFGAVVVSKLQKEPLTPEVSRQGMQDMLQVYDLE